MDITFVLAQIFAFLGWLFLIYSYYKDDIQKLLRIQILAVLFDTLSYLLLGADAGLLICGFELVKCILYYKTDKDKYIYYLTLPIYIGIVYFTGFDAITLLAVLGSLIDGYVLLKSKHAMVVGGIVSYTLWVIYDLVFFDFAGAISDIFVVLSNISILIRGYSNYLRRSSIYTVKAIRISMSTVHVIDKLDKKALDGEYRWDEDTIKTLTKDHKYSYILVKDGNKVIGYVNFLNLKENIYEKMLKSFDLYDDFSEEDIVDFIKNRKAYLNLNAIVLNDDYFNSDTTRKIENAIKRYIRTMRKNRYYIQELCCFAVNRLETKVLEDLGFEKVRDVTNECFLYRKIVQ